MSLSCLFLNTYYEAFLRAFYSSNPALLEAPYSEQLKAIQACMFGDSDFYSHYLSEAGWIAQDVIMNCAPIQYAWARENGVNGELGFGLAVEQVKRIRPDVLYIQDMHIIKQDFIDAVRPYVQLIAGQVASALPSDTPFGGYDVIVSSFPHFVTRLREGGVNALYQPLAFDPRVLSRLEILPLNRRPFQFSFVGGISPSHANALSSLETLCRKTSIEVFGYGRESLDPASCILPRHRGEVWAKEMFQTIASSRITWNRHVEAAEGFANNMRLFEATGCGAMLVTDYKDNLNELFEIGREIVAYRSIDECIALVEYYLLNPDKAEVIAAAGQARTLRDHTYSRRMQQTAEFFERQIRYRREKGRFGRVDMSRISCGYAPIDRGEITQSMTSAWQSSEIPARQRALVQDELENMYTGKPPVVHRAMARILQDAVQPGSSVLEIGCSSGYYYEVIEYLLNKRILYHGVDYSAPMIDMAREYYPHAKFTVADGAALPFADREFDVAISSCILLHVPNYAQHISETVRVAGKFVAAHRTPVCRKRPTQYRKKMAYGIETAELIFNESEIVTLFTGRGLELIAALELEYDHPSDQYTVSYLFRRTR